MNNEVLWRWRELCAALSLPEVDGPEVQGISIDSRSANAGDLFVALTGDPGPRFHVGQRSTRDGHDFIAAATRAGAVGALVHIDAPEGVVGLRVDDTLDGLWALGAAARARFAQPVVAVTGSSGKTTVKTFLKQALGAFATPGSLNNHLGVPLSLARTPLNASAAVYEIGMNHPGEIEPLARLVRPHVAVVVNVHPVHTEYFDDLDAIRVEKLSIGAGLEAGGTLVAPYGLNLQGVAPGHDVVTFGEDPNADVQLVSMRGNSAQYRTPSGPIEAAVPGGGMHRAVSLASVVAALIALHRPVEAAAGLNPNSIPKGRGNRSTVNGIVVIDDSYNANPASMTAALESLASEAAGRRIAILGDMLELGDAARGYHTALGRACEPLDGVYCVGSLMRSLYEALPAAKRLGHAASPTDIEMPDLHPGDVVLVKGSNRIFWAEQFVDALLEKLG